MFVPVFRSTSRIALIQLISPEHDDRGRDCSTSIIVSAISKERTRNTAIVFAEDKLSGLILRCDVIVDVISALDLVTTTRELYMEEAPEAFEVRAYDDQGSVEILEVFVVIVIYVVMINTEKLSFHCNCCVLNFKFHLDYILKSFHPFPY